MKTIKNTPNLGKKLQTLREIYKINMDSLASKLNLNSAQNYYHIESGRKKNISLPQIEKLAEIYEVSQEFLLDNTKIVNIESIYRKSETINVTDNSCSNKIIELLKHTDHFSKNKQSFMEQFIDIILKNK